MSFKEQLMNSQTIYTGRVFDVSVDTVVLPNGKQTTREFVHHRQAVAILPIGNDGKIILIRQYRHCTGEELLEIPAGSIDDGEHSEEALQRELAEETGYIAGRYEKLCSAYTTPGFTNEFTHFYVAKDLSPHKRQGDDDEFIAVEPYSVGEVMVMIRQGAIKDAKTVLAIAYYLQSTQA